MHFGDVSEYVHATLMFLPEHQHGFDLILCVVSKCDDLCVSNVLCDKVGSCHEQVNEGYVLWLTILLFTVNFDMHVDK